MAETNEFQTEHEPLPETRPEEVEQPVTNEVEAAEEVVADLDEHGFDRLDPPLDVVKEELLIDDETAEVDGPVLTEVCRRDRHKNWQPEAAQESADELPAGEMTDRAEKLQTFLEGVQTFLEGGRASR